MKRIIPIFIVILASNLTVAGQCGTLSNNIWENTWESCEIAVNPNSSHEDSHWILYNFGALHKLTTTHIWNTNEIGKTDRGFRHVSVDYSLNGVDWLELGAYELEQASGETQYGGFTGFDFGGRCARYVLITALANWGHDDCFGLAEIKFNTDVDYNSECGVITASVELIDELMDLKVFPNPTADWLYVRLDGFKGEIMLTVSTADGRAVFKESMWVDANNQFTYPVHHLPAGTYFLTVQTQDAISTQRFITIR